MIDEKDLQALRLRDAGASAPYRPVDEVLARGTRLRRQRRVLRATGATSVLAGLVAAGVFALESQTDHGPEVQVTDDPSTTTTATNAPPPPKPSDCWPFDSPEEPGDLPEPLEVSPSELPDEVRVLPAWTPSGEEIAIVGTSLWENPCLTVAPHPVDDVLLLEATSGQGWISLSGPLPWPQLIPWLEKDPETEGFVPGLEPTELRGGDAAVKGPGLGRSGGSLRDVTFEWTEPDGWSWRIVGDGIDEPDLRALAEALKLNSSPAEDGVAAGLAPEGVPSGFEITRQRRGEPVLAEPVQATLSMTVGEPPDGFASLLDVESGSDDFRPIAGAGEDIVTVNGSDAVWAPAEQTLTWEISPGVTATATVVSSPELTTIIRFAESVEPVPADDPRLSS